MFGSVFIPLLRIDLAGGIEGGVVALFKLYQKIKGGVVELLAISELNQCVC